MNPYQLALRSVQNDPRYRQNLDWGKPRSGHPEGSVRAHIEELEGNLSKLPVAAGSQEHWKLMLLIHVHDSFKKESCKGVAIGDPRSHASLARQFLVEHCSDPDLAQMVQWHDEPFALYRQETQKGSFNRDRLDALLRSILDWELFLMFLVIDGATAGKSREPLQWSVRNLAAPRGLAEAMRGWMAPLAPTSEDAIRRHLAPLG